VVAFLQQCERTGLDPIARQIYAIERGGKWTIQVSIDGMRLVAQRSRMYRGQSQPQWTDGSKARAPMRDLDGSIIRDADGSIVWTEELVWSDVWTGEGYPVAARVSVFREDFDQPLTAVARWESYKVENDEWRDNRKTGNKVLGATWAKMPDLMLAKVAEALALRKAFPMDLSGLYTEEEMDGQTVVVPEGKTRQKRGITTIADRARAAQSQAAVVDESGDEDIQDAEVVTDPVSASDGPVEPGSAIPAGGFPCTECGLDTASEDGGICGPCEVRIEAEISAEQEQES
jgi:phage recombination protein Bet